MELVRGKIAKDFWNQEHSRGPGFKELAEESPSIAVTKFVDYLKSEGVPLQGKLLEVGCGLGRNTNWLAQQGFEVTGVDFSDVAIEKASKRAHELGTEVQYQVLDIASKLPFLDNSVDYVLDILTSQLLTRQDRERYIREARRVLKPGGKLLLYTLDHTIDKEARRLIREYPGSEENSYVIPESGLIEKTFSLEEIGELYGQLKIESSELIFYPSEFKGKIYDRYFWWVVLKK